MRTTNLTVRVIRDERGEGVISAAIAVLIMAFLGVLMWVGFSATLGDTQQKVDDQVTQVGDPSVGSNTGGGGDAGPSVGGTGDAAP